MNIRMELTKTLKQKPTDETKLGFGHIFTDHMFIMNYDTGEGWHDARIVPYQNLSLSPAAMCLHYGQEALKLIGQRRERYSFSVRMKTSKGLIRLTSVWLFLKYRLTTR